MKRSFESLVAEAVEKRAEIRVKPERDPRTGNLVFIAHLHGLASAYSRFLITGSVITPIEREPSNG